MMLCSGIMKIFNLWDYCREYDDELRMMMRWWTEDDECVDDECDDFLEEV